MQRKRHDFPEERDTDTDLMPSARPPPSASDPPEEPRASSSTWRPRPPPASTTYTIVPPREEARMESIYPPRAPSSKPPRRSEPPLRGYEAPIFESGEMRAERVLTPLPEQEERDELTPRQRAWIDQLHGALDAMTHYEVLGIPESADRDALRQAYFTRVAAHHPDRYFGKRTGLYGRKVQTIFSRINDAYASLRDPDARAAYDAWLAQKRKKEEAREGREERAVRPGPPDR